MRTTIWTSVIGLLVLLAGCAQQNGTTLATSPQDPASTIPAPLAEAARKYNLEIGLVKRPAPLVYFFMGIHAARPTTQGLIDDAPGLADGINLYPPEFFERLKLRRIELYRSKRPRKDWAGFAFSSQDAIHVRVGDHTDKNSDWPVKTLHHELFHVLDHRDGNAYDEQWKALNPASFRYNPLRLGGRSSCHSPGTGFVSGNGRVNPGEDKADFFAFMVTHYATVRDLAERDEIVRAKADLMEAIVADFCPSLNAEFWAKAKRRSEAPERRALAALQYRWRKVEPGIDPLTPDDNPDAARAIVRPTRFPDCHESSAPGKLTALNVSWHELVRRLYQNPEARLIAPKELTSQSYDIIVSLPDVEKEWDPRIYTEARKAFESTQGLSVHKESREADVYVIRLRKGDSNRLQKLARNAQRFSAARKRWAWWRKLWKKDKPPTESFASDDWDGQIICGLNELTVRNMPIGNAAKLLKWSCLNRPTFDETGFTQPINVTVEFDSNEPTRCAKRLADALGVEIVSERRKIGMTVLEKQ